jgi:hypothetical protein
MNVIDLLRIRMQVGLCRMPTSAAKCKMLD